jgi:hypothetical protein
MGRLKDGLLRILAGEPWTERRGEERRSATERRHYSQGGNGKAERRRGERRQEDRRGKGWLRFWNPS